MNRGAPGGYAGHILRVDLTSGNTWSHPWTPNDMRSFVGGAGLGAKILWDEVPAGVAWDHPENRLILATGPLAGLPVWGTGGLSVVTRGAMTNGGTSTQANGFFGACLKYSGYDAIVVQGQSSGWVYLYVQDGVAELRDAAFLVGKDTWETQDALQAQIGYSGHQMSVYGIGPAGENLVRFSAIAGDYGHVASKNGCGAVMGKKRLKAVAVVRDLGSRNGTWLNDIRLKAEAPLEVGDRLGAILNGRWRQLTVVTTSGVATTSSQVSSTRTTSAPYATGARPTHRRHVSDPSTNTRRPFRPRDKECVNMVIALSEEAAMAAVISSVRRQAQDRSCRTKRLGVQD